MDGEFSQWSPTTQGAILSSFFYGYIITQIPGGYLAHNYGGKTVFVAGVFGKGISCFYDFRYCRIHAANSSNGKTWVLLSHHCSVYGRIA